MDELTILFNVGGGVVDMMEDQRLRTAAVAGLFYPATASVLRGQLELLLAAAAPGGGECPRALIVPHAGYVYSGAAAAQAYARLSPWRAQIKRVLVLGPPHRVAVRGLAMSSATAFATPLGELPIDTSAMAAWSAVRELAVNDPAHADEHSIEVQLPFLQSVLGDIRLLPMLVAESSPQRLADLLASDWQQDDTLIVVSTDLSHFLAYDRALQRDGETDHIIMHLDATRIGPEQACGYRALNGVLALAARCGARIERLALCNSGDTAGNRERVVGYSAYALY